jgi:hypothetical protein
MHAPFARPLLVVLSLVLSACGVNPEALDGGGGGGAGGGDGAGGGAAACDATTDLTSNPLHCGSCGHACQFPNAVPSCSSGVCGVKSCAAGFRDVDGQAGNGCEASCAPLVVGASGNLDFNVSVLQLSGRVMLGGKSSLPGAPRGSLSFELAGSKAVDVALPTAGEAAFSVKLFAGYYKVVFNKTGDCRAGALPCGRHVVFTGFLTASGAMDFDLDPASTMEITLTGTVTRNGAPLAPGPRGEVRFVSAGKSVGASSALPVGGPASYSAVLVPGVYDVIVEGPGQCPQGSVVPCYASIRRRNVSLTASGNLDLDLPIVEVTGAVSVNGQAMAGASSERGRLQLVDADGKGPSVSLGSSGPAQWAALVYAGPHDVVVSRPTCTPGPVPCQSRKVKSAVPLNAAGVLDVDLKVLDVTGQVLANGQLLGPSARGGSRGTVSFKADGTGPSVDLGVSAASVFAVKLYEGSYDVSVGNTGDCPTGPLPCGTKKVKTITVNASGVLDVDVPVIVATGLVTVNGGQMGPGNASRGTLTFTGPSTVAVPLTSSGDAAWSATLHPGTYKVAIDNLSDCEGGPVPCQKRVLEAGRLFGTGEAVTWHLPVVEVTGAVTLNGQSLALASANKRGELLFKEPSLGTLAVSLGASGPVGYRAKLYPASYQVLFRNSTDCTAGDAQPLPCQGEAEVEAGAALTSSGVKDFNLASVTLSGTVQVNSSQMGASSTGAPRGVMRFAAFASSASASRPLSPSGAANFQIRLLPGRYDVGLENVSDCTAAGALPCQKQVLAGCEAP